MLILLKFNKIAFEITVTGFEAQKNKTTLHWGL